MEDEVFSVDQLLTMNETMLGRGVPVQDDGVGYNKADYGACANYYYGLSDAQIADLAKRLVKYSNTQLHIDKELMKKTAQHYLMKVTGEFDRADGISVDVTEDGTKIGFKYNEDFIEVIKSQPKHKRRYDGESKQWIVDNDIVVSTLIKLSLAGADVNNAIEYVNNHDLIKNPRIKKTDVMIVINDNYVCIKFDYNESIVEEIKNIERSARRYNAEHKYWIIDKSYIKPLMKSLKNIANFKMVGQG